MNTIMAVGITGSTVADCRKAPPTLYHVIKIAQLNKNITRNAKKFETNIFERKQERKRFENLPPRQGDEQRQVWVHDEIIAQ